ncbi:glycosyltransferase [Candidatus Pelagibacter sp.]|nr:glycosyltransferase [Candidatus Pelagibacter sp.]
MCKEKNKPLISIITVTLNSEKYLKETLKSIFNQKYKNYELIIIDGKSNDKTLNIIKKNIKKINLYKSEKDKGIYDAFNKGIKLASGDLIGIVNSDDILKPNALKILVKYYNKYPKMDFFFGSVKKHWGILHGYNKWKIFYTWAFYSGHSTGFFIKKDAAKLVGCYNLKYKYHADWDYMYRMIVHHKLNGVATKKNEIFGIFRPGGFSSHIKYIDHFLETIQIRKDNGQAKIVVYLISLIKYFYNRHRFSNKNILSIIIKKVFFA